MYLLGIEFTSRPASNPPPSYSLCTLPISRDVLPFTLKLPEAITTAKSPTDLEEVAKLGAGWILLYLLSQPLRLCSILFVDDKSYDEFMLS